MTGLVGADDALVDGVTDAVVDGVEVAVVDGSDPLLGVTDGVGEGDASPPPLWTGEEVGEEEEVGVPVGETDGVGVGVGVGDGLTRIQAPLPPR